MSTVGIDCYTISRPFGHILPAVESVTKAFQFLPSRKIQQNPKTCFGFWYFVSTVGIEHYMFSIGYRYFCEIAGNLFNS